MYTLYQYIAMKCIFCSHKNTSVINSRSTKGNTIVWRRRQCVSCKDIFTTREGTFTDNLFLIKRNGKRQRFVYEKLLASIFVVLNLGKERDSGDQALRSRKVTYDIIDGLRDIHAKTISTKDVVRITYKALIKISQHTADSYMFYSSYRTEIIQKMSFK